MFEISDTAASENLENMSEGMEMSAPIVRDVLLYLELTPKTSRPKGSAVNCKLNLQDIYSLRRGIRVAIAASRGIAEERVIIQRALYYRPRQPPCQLETSADCFKAATSKPLKIGVIFGKYLKIIILYR